MQQYGIMWNVSGCSKSWYPKTALTPPFREPFAPLRAPAESGHGIMIRFSCANSSQRFTGGLYLKTRYQIGDPFSKLLQLHSCCACMSQCSSPLDFWTLVLHPFFEKPCRMRPFWVRAGSGRIRLSRTFREPFAELSPKKCDSCRKLMYMQGWHFGPGVGSGSHSPI